METHLLGYYGGPWAVVEGESLSVYRKMPDGEIVSVELQHAGDPILYEGWWPRKPEKIENIVSGVCLWDGRWQVEFEKSKGNPPGRRSLALPKEREEAYQRISMGKVVTRMYLPYEPGEYHRRLIVWQAKKFKELKPKKILYHLPLDEYRRFIYKFEFESGCEIPSAYQTLLKFYEAIKSLVEKSFSGIDSEVIFINPWQMDTVNSETESFSEPYLRPQAFGIPADSLCGVEDLVELRLSYEAQKIRNVCVPVLVAVIGLPSPYLDKTLTSVQTLEL